MRINGVSSAAITAQTNLTKATNRLSRSLGHLAAGGSAAGFAQDVVDLKTSEVAAKASTKALKVILDTEQQLIGALLDKQG